MVRVVAILAAGALMLAGCGTIFDELSGSQTDGQPEGAALGHAAGAMVPAGADAGAAAAALNAIETQGPATPKKKPERTHRVRVPSDAVRAIQLQLAALGYEPGPPDGLTGPLTRAALKRYQEDRGLPADGKITQAIKDRIAGEAEQGSQLSAMVELDPCSDEARRRAGLLRAAIRWIFAEKPREDCQP